MPAEKIVWNGLKRKRAPLWKRGRTKRALAEKAGADRGRRTDGGTHARKVGILRGGRRRVESPFGDQRGSGRRARAELSATV